MTVVEPHWTRRVFVGCEWVDPAGTDSIPVRDPSADELLGHVAAAGPADVDTAVMRARAALEGDRWAGGGVADRSAALRGIAQAIRDDAAGITDRETADSGKPLAQARKEVDSAADVFDYYAGAVDKVFGATIPIRSGIFNFTTHAPVGVVAAVVPWNFPFLSVAWKLAPALAAGCSVIVKPAAETPLSALGLADLLAASAVPAGRVSILPGGGALGQALTTHPGVDQVSFTGSTATGKRVMAAAAESVKRVSLELGGKNANIVFPDAPFPGAPTAAAGSAFGNAGQSCSARSRILLVDEDDGSFGDRFVEALVEEAESLHLGDPRDPGTTMGPLISAGHRETVDDVVRRGVDAGGRCVTGGARPPAEETGFYYPPTVVVDVEPDNVLMTDEVFGPVVAVHRCGSEEEALRVANGTRYGLAGSVWTRDLERACRVASRLDVGMATVNTNGSASRFAYFGPFGGTRESGLGRELGLEGLELYLETKNVLVEFGTER